MALRIAASSAMAETAPAISRKATAIFFSMVFLLDSGGRPQPPPQRGDAINCGKAGISQPAKPGIVIVEQFLQSGRHRLHDENISFAGTLIAAQQQMVAQIARTTVKQCNRQRLYVAETQINALARQRMHQMGSIANQCQPKPDHGIVALQLERKGGWRGNQP